MFMADNCHDEINPYECRVCKSPDKSFFPGPVISLNDFVEHQATTYNIIYMGLRWMPARKYIRW